MRYLAVIMVVVIIFDVSAFCVCYQVLCSASQAYFHYNRRPCLILSSIYQFVEGSLSYVCSQSVLSDGAWAMVSVQ